MSSSFTIKQMIWLCSTDAGEYFRERLVFQASDHVVQLPAPGIGPCGVGMSSQRHASLPCSFSLLALLSRLMRSLWQGSLQECLLMPWHVCKMRATWCFRPSGMQCMTMCSTCKPGLLLEAGADDMDLLEGLDGVAHSAPVCSRDMPETSGCHQTHGWLQFVMGYATQFGMQADFAVQ